MRQPRVDPDVVRGTVQHPVGLAARAREVQEELEQYVAAGAGAHLARLGGDERAGEPIRQELAVGRRARLGAGELPPALVLIFGEATLLAGRQQQQQPIDEVGLLVSRDAEPGRVGEQGAKREVELGRRGREVGGSDDLRSTGTRHLHPCRRDEVREHAVALASERNPAHGVRKVTIEAGKEAKAVFAGEIAAALGPRPGHRHAPRLSARDRARLEDHDLEVALGELVSSAHPRDPASEDEHPRAHPAPAGMPLTAAVCGGSRSWVVASSSWPRSTPLGVIATLPPLPTGSTLVGPLVRGSRPPAVRRTRSCCSRGQSRRRSTRPRGGLRVAPLRRRGRRHTRP